MYQKADFIKAIDLVVKKKIQLRNLISNEFPFIKYMDAYKYITSQKDRVMKVLISLND